MSKRIKINRKKIRKPRQVVSCSKVGLFLNVNDNIIFNNQKEVFDLFNIKANPNQQGAYKLEGTIFSLWFPNVPKKKDFVENYLNINRNVIFEKYCTNKPNLKNIISEEKYITFSKENNEIKFIGVFREYKAGNKNHIFRKISNNVIIEPISIDKNSQSQRR